jgi:hypothetical protein
MQNKRAYIERIAELTVALEKIDADDPDRFFTPTLETMKKDSARWIDNEWLAPNGSTTPVERAIVILTQDLIVLLGHAANSDIKHSLLHDLANAATTAANEGVIEDARHCEYFTDPESPLHTILKSS